MRIVVLAIVLTLTTVTFAQGPAPTPGAASAKPPQPQEVVYEGELETYIAVGGESTGWRLRRRTPQGRREYIEVLLTADRSGGR